MPQLSHQLFNIFAGRRLESMEQGSQVLLVEEEKLLDLGSC